MSPEEIARYNRMMYIRDYRRKEKENEIIYIKKDTVRIQNVYDRKFPTQSRKKTAENRFPSNGSTQCVYFDPLKITGIVRASNFCTVPSSSSTQVNPHV